MKLTEALVNEIVDDVAARLNGGTLRIFEAPPTAAFSAPLVSLQLGNPAFHPAKGGKTSVVSLAKAQIDQTGEASYGELVTVTGDVLATLAVASKDAADVRDADVVADRTDFHRGGFCEALSVVLRLPLS